MVGRMNEKTKTFVDDLFAVMEKHGVSIDCYYGEIDYIGAKDKNGCFHINISSKQIEREWFRRWNERETTRKIEAQKLKMSRITHE